MQERAAINRTHAEESRAAQERHSSVVEKFTGLEEQLRQITADREADRVAANREREDLVRTLTVEKQGQLASKEADIDQRERTIAKLVMERDTAVADMQKATEAFVKDRGLLKAEGDRKVAELAAKHDAELQQFHAEKRALEETLAEREATLVQRDETIAALRNEVSELKTRLADTERKLREEIAAITAQREEARAEIAVLNARLTAQSNDAKKDRDAVDAERLAVTKERDALAAALKEAKESHESESTALSKEFRGVIRQRDEAVARMEGERAAHQQHLETVERQFNEKAIAEAEIRARLEQDNARLRQDRDDFGRERDELRERIEKLFDQQREFLTGSAGPGYSLPRRETARPQFTVPPPEPVQVHPNVYVKPRGRVTEPVDFVVENPPPREEPAAEHDPEKGVKLNPIRPLSVRPPQVRVPLTKI
jgi:chromosome segregation ATPase